MRSVRVGEIAPAPWNPRVELRPNDPEWESLKASIEEFGIADPLIVSERSPWLAGQKGDKRTLLLVGGHQRLSVLVALGWERLEVGPEIKLLRLASERTEKRLCLALNRNDGRWDEDKLAALVVEVGDRAEMSEASALGFTVDEYETLLARAETIDGNVAAPESFPTKDEETVTTEHECPSCGYKF